MGMYLGIDTSNYTTSLALYDSDSNVMEMEKKLLPTKEGALGLRQSDAVFAHIKQLPALMETLRSRVSAPITAVGVSAFPRRAEGSYMPCFLVGETAAVMVSQSLKVPLYRFSHQEGHVAAAVYSAEKPSLFSKPFLAFHLSGGTTDALLITPKAPFFSVEQVASSLDLKAGQVVDRVGLMLGLSFPCGPALTALAVQCDEKISVKATMKGCDCCLSGIENQAKTLLAEGRSPSFIARFALASIDAALTEMTKRLIAKYGSLPLLYAGGVMSNVLIRAHMEQEFSGIFAEPAYSSDNSAGIAFLASLCHEEKSR